MNQDRDGTHQASQKARCGRLALSMQAETAAGRVKIAPAPQPDEIVPPASHRPSRLSTSERLRRLEEFSVA